MDNGLASAAHQDHHRQRLVMQPAFRHEHLPGYAAVMRQEITATLQTRHDSLYPPAWVLPRTCMHSPGHPGGRNPSRPAA